MQHIEAGWREWIGFFLLGTLNNLGFVIVISGAKSIANSFNDGNLIGVINWADVALGLAVKAANAVLFQGTSFHYRVFANTVVAALGLLGVALAGDVGFAFAVASITLIGAASSFGESVLLGFLKYYPPSMAGAWSSGTGAAGVVGAGYYLAMHGAGISDRATFLTALPTMIIYWCAFACILRKPGDNRNRASISLPRSGASGAVPGSNASYHRLEDGAAGGESAASDAAAAVEKATLVKTGRGSDYADEDEAAGDGSTSGKMGPVSFARIVRCVGMITWYSFNLYAVYFLEYTISVGCAAKANGEGASTSSDWFVRNSYAVLAFCYQFGVLLSRSSLAVVRVKRIGWLSLVQAINFVLWILQAKYHVVGVAVQFVGMAFVGLMGGAMYVNVFANLVDDPEIPDRDRELCINLASIANNLGIVSASIFEIVMDATFLKSA